MSDVASIAIFDLDRTLHSGSGLGVLARMAFRERIIGADRLARSLFHDMIYRQRGSTDGQISSIVEIALKMAAGFAVADLEEIVERAAQSIASSIRPAMRLLLDNHLRAGHDCVLLSASPDMLVTRIAELIGCDHGIGSLVGVEDGILTGHIVKPMCYGQGKLIRLEEAMGWGLENSHHSFSYAYADSMSDLPLLEAVEAPVVISPDRPLRKLANQRDWPVIDF